MKISWQLISTRFYWVSSPFFVSANVNYLASIADVNLKSKQGRDHMITFNFEKIEQKNSTGYMWIMANNMLNELLSVLCSNETETLFVNYFARKTFGFLKLKEKLSTDDLQEHLLVNLCNTYKAKSRLLKKFILIRMPGNYYCLNIVGITSLYRDIFSPYYCSTKVRNLDALCSLAKNKMSREGVDIIYLMQGEKERKLKLQEALKTNKIKRSESKAKRRKIFMGKEIKTVSQVIGYADNRCEEFGVEYRKDVPLIGKERGQVANWLKGCVSSGVSPNEILDKVCENWKDLNRKIRGRQGEEVLTTTFSFPKFYRHRKDIADELPRILAQEKITVIHHQM